MVLFEDRMISECSVERMLIDLQCLIVVRVILNVIMHSLY